ncbi:hypothetical protein HJFPF1_00589 [Paramyrothecium foliicola]|nr:hypothetical protein HJFPF1_00589 [Paramyrothecium foliicola]
MATSRGRPTAWLWRDDEEMAKKDDDLRDPRRSAHRHAQPGQWQPTRVPRRSVLVRRIAFSALAVLVVFALYKAFSLSSDSPMDAWAAGLTPQDDSPYASSSYSPRPAKTRDRGSEQPKSYEGPIKFPHLGASLHAISETNGHSLKNRNVLFAAASLRSASALLPMACDMAEERQNYVHFAFLGRDTIAIPELLKINGIDTSCRIIPHDARPTHSSDSTERRMALASARALYHINSYMHPQAILLDSTSTEEVYFLAGFRDQVRSTKAALIELPDRPATRLSWLKKLDASALGAWNSIHFDILVHAPPTGTANLGRLLRSLQRVDLAGISVPHLTIELPPALEKGMQNVLSRFQWPPVLSKSASHPQMLTLNHRIPNHRMTEEERSVRFLESFWPKSPGHNHVLILSPQTEISSQFLHYVKYCLLHRRYSTKFQGEADTRLMGMSFSIPATYPDAVKSFEPPQWTDEQEIKRQGTFFLWQSPASDAVLLLGNKWVELHAFVSQVLEIQSSMPTTPALLAKKEVSKKYPSWMEHLMRLSRLRGYYTMYPSLEVASSIIGVHTDLNSLPEEYQDESTNKEEEEWATGEARQGFDPKSNLDVFTTFSKSKASLSSIDDDGPPLLTWDGEEVELVELDQRAAKFAEEFRRNVGQCDDEQLAQMPPPDAYARDLFCKKKSE